MLVVTWLVFAVLATTAGFAAVGLVGDGLEVAEAPAGGSGGQATPSPSGSSTTTPAPTSTTSAASPVGHKANRSLRGNFVSATCRGDLVTLSASPAPGWTLDDYRPGPGREARARFRSDAGDVEFRVYCSRGTPVFDTKDDPDNSGSDD